MNFAYESFVKRVSGQIESARNDGVFEGYNDIWSIWPENTICQRGLSLLNYKISIKTYRRFPGSRRIASMPLLKENSGLN